MPAKIVVLSKIIIKIPFNMGYMKKGCLKFEINLS